MLSKAEEKIMRILWKKKEAFMKDIMDELPEPKPAKTTLSTLLKRMIDKDMVKFETIGNIRRYSPEVDRKVYSGKKYNEFLKAFFNNSSTQFASFFTKETNLSITELEEIRALIDDEIKKKKP